jgi:hypothetical protein
MIRSTPTRSRSSASSRVMKLEPIQQLVCQYSLGFFRSRNGSMNRRTPMLPASCLAWMWSIDCRVLATQLEPASAITSLRPGNRSNTPDITSDQSGRCE